MRELKNKSFYNDDSHFAFSSNYRSLMNYLTSAKSVINDLLTIILWL